MVGTFISKYLLVTTSTITVTSSAAVTFFVAKHLKVGKGYEKAMDYIKAKHKLISRQLDNKVSDESRILSEISEFMRELKKECGGVKPLEGFCKEKILLVKAEIYDKVSKIMSLWNSRELERQKSELEDILDAAGISVSDYD